MAFSININPVGAGSASVIDTYIEDYGEEGTITYYQLSAEANTGYEFSSWTIVETTYLDGAISRTDTETKESNPQPNRSLPGYYEAPYDDDAWHGVIENYYTLCTSVTANFTKTGKKTITVVASPSECGDVSGGGEYSVGDSCTITATERFPHQDLSQYESEFQYWRDGQGNVVSRNSSYTFTVTEGATYTAVFKWLGGCRLYYGAGGIN